MATAPLALHEALEEQGHACAICQTAIAAGEPVGRCPGCDAPFHAECWEENGGCASYGCPHAPSEPKADGPGEGSSYWGQEDKECPGCHQRIRLAALRCRHCGKTFESRAPAAPGPGAPARRPSGGVAVWILVLGLVPFTAPLVLAAGGLGLWLGRGRVRRWPPLRRAMAVVGVVAAAVVSLLVALVVVLHEPPPPPVPAAAPGAEQADGAGDEDEDEALEEDADGSDAEEEPGEAAAEGEERQAPGPDGAR